jgi:hypothetical protein
MAGAIAVIEAEADVRRPAEEVARYTVGGLIAAVGRTW